MKNCNSSNMDGVIEQFDSVASITPIGDRFDQDNFYNAGGWFQNTALNKAWEARQKRKADESKAKLEASKGLAKGADNSVILSTLAEPTSAKKSSNTTTIILVSLGIVALGVGGYFLLRKKK